MLVRSMQLIGSTYQLHYDLEFSVDVGVSLDIHFWFISGSISLDIGAEMHIAGPSFGGGAT